MVVLRFQRRGSTNKPAYRLVAADQRFKRDGRFLEILGVYHPRQAKGGLTVKVDRVKHWLERGAKPSLKVYHLLKKTALAELGTLLTKSKP